MKDMPAVKNTIKKKRETMRNLHYLTDSALDTFERHKAKLKNGGTEGS